VAKKIDFNPVKEDKDGVKAKRMIWSSKSLELAVKGLGEGRKLVANPFYENNIKLLKGDLVFQRTPEEIAEWKKCKNDVLYFAEKYCKLLTPEGIKHITLRDYQKKYLSHLQNNRLSIYLACRQCGKTTTSAIFMLHYILFNVDKNALVLGNKRKTAIEILDKAKKIFFEIPYFLKPGIYKWNEGEIVLDNGCRLMAEATTINSGISFTFHCVLADEFAHISPNIMESFYNNIFPTITAARARFIITSTQNGRNLFYRLFKAAEAGENEYSHFVTNWWEVPEYNPDKKCWEKRDEAWHQRQVANYGSEEAFNSQFGTNFDISSNTLISQKILSKKSQRTVEFISQAIPGVPYSDYFYWHPDFDPVELRNEYIIITCDLSEGIGGDYTIFLINRMIDPESGKLECIGFFRANNVDREEYARTLQMLICLHCDQNKTLISYERNTYGDLFYKQLFDNANTDPKCSTFDMSIIVRYPASDGSKKYFNGIKITSGNKTVHCRLFKEDYEKDLIINDSFQASVELGNFNDDGTGHYKAVFGHDDIIMAMVQLMFVKTTVQYKSLKSDFDSLILLKQQESQSYNIYAEPWGMSPYPVMEEWNFDDYSNLDNNLSRMRRLSHM
jgi:hypothetical protein